MTTSARDYLAAEADRKLAEASNINEQAAKAVRSLTDDERSHVERLIGEVTQIKSRIQEMDDNAKIVERIESMRGPVNDTVERTAKSVGSIGEAFVKSGAYEAMKTGIKNGALGGRWTTGPVEMDLKALLDSGAGLTPEPDRLGGIRQTATTQLRRLTIEDLLMTGTTDSSSIKYLRESAHTNGAAAVAEGAQKPESAFTFDEVDEPVRKVATFLPVTDEMLEDEAQLRAYLDGRLRLFVEHAKESQILSGSGTAPNLTGLLNRTGVQTTAIAAPGVGITNAPGLDYIFEAITDIRVNGMVEPDGIVMHPTNWAAQRMAKDANQQYYGGGPFTGQYGNGGIANDAVWGLPVVTTTAIPVNTVLVGAFGSQAQVFYRNGLTVEASNSHADFFQYNKTAIRAEQRLALAVYRPEAFAVLTGFQNAGATG